MKGTSAHVALELTHVEPVDQWSGKRKADGVWHFCQRAGQRHAALKRAARNARVTFLIHGPHAIRLTRALSTAPLLVALPLMIVSGFVLDLPVARRGPEL